LYRNVTIKARLSLRGSEKISRGALANAIYFSGTARAVRCREAENTGRLAPHRWQYTTRLAVKVDGIER